ncbi:MAG: hypothetical protein QME87_02125 [Bacillota bacterium]|nr:hypothetical protein [Bacillota bacterium]
MRRTEGVLASDVVPVRSDSSCERALKVMMSRLLSEPIQRILEDANIKLASVATDVTGVSAGAILHGLLRGEMDAESMAQLARGRMRNLDFLPSVAAGGGVPVVRVGS